MHQRQRQGLLLLAAGLLLLLLSACAQNPVSKRYNFVLMDENSEIEIGRTNHPKIIKQYGLYQDSSLQHYVQTVGNKLAAVSHRQQLIYRFTVLDSPVINAFALPGGYIYITRGLMAYLNSEAELAAVLGHEIAHVTARHAVQQQTMARAANIGYTLGSIFFPQLRVTGSQQIFNLFGGVLLSGYGREHELEADGLSAQYLARAGYETKAMIDVISVLKNQATFAAAQAKKQGRKVQGYHGLFASHPDHDTRLQQVVKQADQFSHAKKSLVLRDTYLNQINGLTFGDSQAQGIRSGRYFYHLPLGFALAFPAHWQINHHASRVQAVSMGGKATIEMGNMDRNHKLSPQAFIKKRLKINKLKAGKALSSNGLDGYTGLFKHKARQARVAVLYLDQQAFVFFAKTKENKIFDQFDPDFLATINSLHQLRNEEMALAEELKINIVTTTPNDRYENWAKTSRISNNPLMTLKLLNGDYPDGKLQAGKLAKQIR